MKDEDVRKKKQYIDQPGMKNAQHAFARDISGSDLELLYSPAANHLPMNQMIPTLKNP